MLFGKNLEQVTINLSILDFKCAKTFPKVSTEHSINLSILDFKLQVKAQKAAIFSLYKSIHTGF